MQSFLKYLFTIGFLTWSLGIGLAQPGIKKQIYRTYLDNEIGKWEKIIDDVSKRKASLSVDQQVELIGYYYGFTGWLIEEGRNRDAKDMVEKADELLDELLESHPDNPDLYAFKGAFLGFRIEMNSIKAMVLGPESMKQIDHAVEIGPDRPQGWIEHGNALFYMPKMFGGSKEKALESYEKASRLMEENPSFIEDNWMYLNVLLVLGQGYETTGNYAMAKSIYEKTLQFEPGFKTLRDKVYPAFLKKMETQE